MPDRVPQQRGLFVIRNIMPDINIYEVKQQQFVDHVKELRENLKTLTTAPTLDAAELIVINAKQVRVALTWLMNNRGE